MSSSVHINNKNKDILILGEGPKQALDDTALTAEAKHPIHFTQPRKWFTLRLHYNGNKRLLFVKATKMYQLKANNSWIRNYTLCLGNILKDFTINNIKKTTRVKGIVKFILLFLILLILTIF